MKISEKLVEVSSAEPKLQLSAGLYEDANARLQQSLLNSCSLRELICLINLDMANVLAKEIEDSKEDVSETRRQDCVSVKWNVKAVIREFHGHVSTAEMESAIFVQQHPKFSLSCYVIHDCRKCTSQKKQTPIPLGRNL